MGFGFWEIALLAVVALLFFGGSRIPGLMGDLGKGLASFKRGIAEAKDAVAEGGPGRTSSEGQPTAPVALLEPPAAGGTASAETGRR